MNIANNITNLIGNTPLIKIMSASQNETMVLGKLETRNPTFSVKDRLALALIKTAEESGKINKDTLIIEPTSGNTGIGLASICAQRGYKLILTMPESMSIERRILLKHLGAEIELTPKEKGMKGAIDAATSLSEKFQNTFIPQQFKNMANPQIHYETTGPEIWNDTSGKVDILVAGVGTGGTITGAGKYLKEKKPNIKIIAVEPYQSAVLSGENSGPHKIQGIGAGFIPEVLDTTIIDDIVKIDSDDAIKMAQTLASKEGILAGISAGANVLASQVVANKPENKGKTIVTIICDTGERYLSLWKELNS